MAYDGHKTDKRRILLAEDNLISQLALKRFLQTKGFEVTGVENGEEALRRLRESAYDLVLMDLQMPVLDGVSAARFIRAGQDEPFDESMPIIALTAFSSSEDRKLTAQSGMNQHIAKPVDFDDLLRVLEDCLGAPA